MKTLEPICNMIYKIQIDLQYLNYIDLSTAKTIGDYRFRKKGSQLRLKKNLKEVNNLSANTSEVKVGVRRKK